MQRIEHQSSRRGRRKYLDGAFNGALSGVFIDAPNKEHVTWWFATSTIAPANRTLEILRHMLNKAEAWGYRIGNTNRCRGIRFNRSKTCEKFLTGQELTRLGEGLAVLRASDDPTQQCMGAALTLCC